MMKQDFHQFVRIILMVWLAVYAALLLPGLGKGLIFFVISGFSLPIKHHLDIIFTVYRGALWLVPTLFLVLAYYLSRPKRRYS